MDLISKVIFLHIPQAFLFVYSGLGLMGVRLQMKSLQFGILMALLGILVEVLRRVVFPFHSIALVLIVGVVQRFYFRVGWGTSLAAVFLSFILLNVGEAFLAFAAFPLLGWTPESILQDTLVLYAVGWLTQIPLLIAAIGVYKWNWVLFPLDAARRGERGAAR